MSDIPDRPKPRKKKSTKSTKSKKEHAVELPSPDGVDKVEDPFASWMSEQTCNIENIWKALFWFDFTSVVDTPPREFKPQISIELVKTVVEDEPAAEHLTEQEVEAAELNNVLQHNMVKKLEQEAEVDEDLLALQRQAAAEEEMREQRKRQIKEYREAMGGAEPGKQHSLFLPPPSPRSSRPPSPQVVVGTPPAATPRALPASPALQQSKGRAGLPPTGLTINTETESDKSSQRVRSDSESSGSTPLASNTLSSPYHSSVRSPHFSKVTAATTGDNVPSQDIQNFSRFVTKEGIHCQFYLPARDSAAKPKPARFLCDEASPSFQLDILAGSSPAAGSGGGGKKGDVVVKSLRFSLEKDITAVSKGKGPVVLMPPEVPDECALHISLTDKPEMNLVFLDRATRDVVYNALPRVFANQLTNQLLVEQHVPVKSAVKDLVGLSQQRLRLTSFYWVEMQSKAIGSGGRYQSKLLITRSDELVQLYSVPREFEAHSGSTTPSAAAARQATEVEGRRQALSEQLVVYQQATWSKSFLSEIDFSLMLEFSVGDIQKVFHVGEAHEDHLVEVVFHRRGEESTLALRLSSTDKRKAFIQFLEERRKGSKLKKAAAAAAAGKQELV